MTKPRTRHFFVLGVDPGRMSGAGLLEVYGKQITLMGMWSFGTAKQPCTGTDIWDLMLQAYTLTQGQCIVGIEDQFLPGSAGVGGQRRAHGVSALITSNHAGQWRGMAHIMGWRVWAEQLKPNSWRQGIYGGHRIQRGEIYKEWAMAKVLEVFGQSAKTHHAAEAVLIGYHVCKQILKFGLGGQR